MASISKAASTTERASGPATSREGDSGKTPLRPIRPREVFMPTTPQKQAGVRSEPPVSLPSAAGTSPPATATADPLEDPPGARCTAISQGFQGVPSTGLVPQPP